MKNAKFSQQKFWSSHEIGLIQKNAVIGSTYVLVSYWFPLTVCSLELILVYLNPLRKRNPHIGSEVLLDDGQILMSVTLVIDPGGCDQLARIRLNIHDVKRNLDIDWYSEHFCTCSSVLSWSKTLLGTSLREQWAKSNSVTSGSSAGLKQDKQDKRPVMLIGWCFTKFHTHHTWSSASVMVTSKTLPFSELTVSYANSHLLLGLDSDYSNN